jgi:multiple sugar transport system substrate-binding protein
VPFSRRQLFAYAGAAATVPVLGACGFAPSSAGGESSSAGTQTLTFTTWGTDAELTGFRDAIAAFEAANAGATVTLNVVPYEQMFTNIDAQLQAGNPPDVFRVPYYTFGAYAGRGQLLDLGPHLPAGFSDRFTPQAWAAVQNEGKPFGIPHHTDTSVILYNKTLTDAAGITTFPTTVDEAWTWQQFEDIARTLRSSLPATQYPLVYNWQGNGVTRWLSWLFQSDGRFLAEDLVTPAIDSDAGRAAVDFTKSFFTDQLVPPDSSVKATKYAADIWYSQTAAMTYGGAFLLPDASTTATFEWGATFPPKNVRNGGDFGGNALVATAAAAGKAELLAKFFDSVTQSQSMQNFCTTASLLPTRADLIEQGITFKVRPELSPIFLGQASKVQASDSGQVASPSMSKIITVLKDQLDNAFVAGQSTEDTIAGITSGIAAATAG